MKPAATVSDRYSRDGFNDEISAFLPVGAQLYTAQQLEDLRCVLAHERARYSELFSEYYSACLLAAAPAQPAAQDKVRAALSPENQRVVPVEPLLANPHPLAAAQGEREAPVVVATAILGGLFHGGSGPELGEIDIEVCTPALEALQCETVDSSDDVFMPLMTVAQHNRIVAALSAQQSAHVSVPRELLEDLRDLASDAVDHHRQAFAGYKLERQANMNKVIANADALLNGGEA